MCVHVSREDGLRPINRFNLVKCVCMSQERMDCVPLIGLTKSNVCVCLKRGWIAIPLIGLTKSYVLVCLKRGWIAIPLIGLTKSNVCVCVKRGWIASH